jgi:hypothetical protein
VTDLYPNAAAIRQKQHDAWYLFGYYPLIEAYAVQEKYAEARDILSQAHRILERMRPERSAAPEEKARFAMFEAGYWRAKGILSERQGKKFDALIAYRNALASYGPRSARGDARDAVYASAQRLAKELGSSAEGWTDWEAKQPLPNLRSGHGGSNAWLQLDARHPRLQVTDMQGRTYTPEQLGNMVPAVPGGTALPGETRGAVQGPEGRGVRCIECGRRGIAGDSVSGALPVYVPDGDGSILCVRFSACVRRAGKLYHRGQNRLLRGEGEGRRMGGVGGSGTAGKAVEPHGAADPQYSVK